MRSLWSFSAVFVLAAASSHAEPLVTHCLSTTDANLVNATWMGTRFAVTWYAPGGKPVESAPLQKPPTPRPGSKKPMPPQPEEAEAPLLRAPPEPPPVPRPPARTLEVFFALAEPEGELVGGTTREVSPLDGKSSVMPVLARGAGKLGLTFMDDGSGMRTAAFRLLELDGRPASDMVRVPPEHLPHGDQSALAWNAKTEQWGLVVQGTQPTDSPGIVTHHLYGTRFRGTSPGALTQLDDDGSVTTSHNLALAPQGACFVTAWATGTQDVVWAQWCAEGVKRVPVRRGGKAPMQVTVRTTESGNSLVAWVDHASLAPPTANAAKGNAPGTAPSAPPRKASGGLASLPRMTVFFALLDPAGAVLSTGTLDAGGYAQSPTVLADAAGFWVSWTEQDDAGSRALVARLDGRGQVTRRAEGSSVPGPMWVSLAGSRDGAAVVVSQGNAPDCKVAWATLR